MSSYCRLANCGASQATKIRCLSRCSAYIISTPLHTINMPAVEIEGLESVVGVTVAFLALYFVFLVGQAFIKFYLFFAAKAKDPKASFGKIKYASTDPLARLADRTAGNMLEQSIIFLTSLWLCALFESPSYAARLGRLWLLFRCAYPFLFLKGVWIQLSTIPGYILISMLIAPVAWKATYMI